MQVQSDCFSSSASLQTLDLYTGWQPIYEASLPAFAKMRNDVLFKYSAFLNSLVALQLHSKIGEMAFFSLLLEKQLNLEFWSGMLDRNRIRALRKPLSACRSVAHDFMVQPWSLCLSKWHHVWSYFGICEVNFFPESKATAKFVFSGHASFTVFSSCFYWS